MSEILDSRQLRAFATLARTGSFTATAKDLHLSQSAISHAMKALESDVGCLLLDRMGKKVMLTQAGEQFLRHAERILQEMQATRRDIEQLGRWGAGRLRISASPTSCQYILPTVLRELRESFPQCVIHIQPADTPGAMELLRSGNVDLALAMEPVREPQFGFRHLFTDELQFLVSPLHPWAQTGKVNRATIPKEHYIFYSVSSNTYRIIERHFAGEDMILRSSIELGSMEAIKELVKLGLGISIVTPWIAQEEIESGSLVALPLGRSKLRRRWGITHWRSRRLTLPEETFIGICKSVTSEAPWAKLRNG